MTEEDFQGPRNQGRVIVHGEVEQHPQKGLPSGPVQFQDGAFIAAPENALGLRDVPMEMLYRSDFAV